MPHENGLSERRRAWVWSPVVHAAARKPIGFLSLYVPKKQQLPAFESNRRHVDSGWLLAKCVVQRMYSRMAPRRAGSISASTRMSLPS
jgi:hypothetical protein